MNLKILFSLVQIQIYIMVELIPEVEKTII